MGGKVLVEKLLRSTTVSKIYVLIRLKHLMEARIFDKLRVEDKEALRRVEAVSGDITEEHLGLSFEEESSLVNSVNIIFHCAATVRFDEKMSLSVGMNVAGVGWIVAL